MRRREFGEYRGKNMAILDLLQASLEKLEGYLRHACNSFHGFSTFPCVPAWMMFLTLVLAICMYVQVGKLYLLVWREQTEVMMCRLALLLLQAYTSSKYAWGWVAWTRLAFS